LGVSRGALTFTRLFVQGKPPKDLRKRYTEAVRLRKFTPLLPEDEASEAIGWCVIERPFDLDLQPDRLFYDRFVTLGFRVDKWKIPGVLLRSQVADEEQRMLSRGSGREKLTRAEKEDIKLRVIGRLRKKILPTSRAFDVLWDLDAGTVLLFTHSARTTEEFAAHFEKRKSFKNVLAKNNGAADYYLTGKLKRLYGQQEFSTSAQIGSFFGLIGAIATSGAKTNGSIAVEFSELVLHHKSDAKEKPLENFSDTFSGDLHADANCWAIYENVNSQLKTAVGKLAPKIEQAIAELESPKP